MGGVIAAYPVDLHTHSLRSDGALSPADPVKRAASRAASVLSLSANDPLSGVAEAVATGTEVGVRLIAGSELNAESEWGDAHVLGYFSGPADGALEDRLR